MNGRYYDYIDKIIDLPILKETVLTYTLKSLVASKLVCNYIDIIKLKIDIKQKEKLKKQFVKLKIQHDIINVHVTRKGLLIDSKYECDIKINRNLKTRKLMVSIRYDPSVFIYNEMRYRKYPCDLRLNSIIATSDVDKIKFTDSRVHKVIDYVNEICNVRLYNNACQKIFYIKNIFVKFILKSFQIFSKTLKADLGGSLSSPGYSYSRSNHCKLNKLIINSIIGSKYTSYINNIYVKGVLSIKDVKNLGKFDIKNIHIFRDTTRVNISDKKKFNGIRKIYRTDTIRYPNNFEFLKSSGIGFYLCKEFAGIKHDNFIKCIECKKNIVNVKYGYCDCVVHCVKCALKSKNNCPNCNNTINNYDVFYIQGKEMRVIKNESAV